MEQSPISVIKLKTSGMAILSLVISLIPFLGLVGLILGVIALRAIKKRKQELTGEGLALSGIVVGGINLIASCLMSLPLFLSAINPSPKQVVLLPNIPQVNTEPTNKTIIPSPITNKYNDSLGTKIKNIALATLNSADRNPEVIADYQGEVTMACWYKHIKPGKADDELLTLAVLPGDFATMAQKVFKLPEVNYFRYIVCEKLVDEYGVTKDYWICKIGLSRKTAHKINWENPLLVDYSKIADEYEVGCDLYEGITNISAPAVSQATPPPPPTQASSGETGNKTIKSFTGSANVTTETFNVPTDVWKVTVIVKSDSPEYSRITVYAYADGKNPEKDASDADFSMDGVGSQSSYFRTGKGNYFLEVKSVNCKWTVVVESGK